MTIRNSTRHTILASSAAIADTCLKRLVGLLRHRSLGEGEALILIPCQSVHMMFMKFAIDVIFVDAQKKLVGLCSHLQPFRFSRVFWKSACAIEIPPGTIEKSGTRVGDTIEF